MTTAEVIQPLPPEAPDPEGETWIRKTPNVCGGDACIRNTRIMVWLLEAYRRSGMSNASILESYPSLTEADLRTMEPKWKRVLQIRRLAGQMQRSPLEAALQFSLSIEHISVTILGMRTPQHLAANLQYYAARGLSNEEMSELLAH